MSSLFVGLLSVFFLIYAAANYYIGLRMLQSFRSVIDSSYIPLYWLVYALLTLSPFAARIGRNYFPGNFNEWVTVIGDYWLAAVYYLFLLWMFADILLFGLSRLFPAFAAIRQPSFATGGSIVLLASALLLYGAWNARNPQVHHYDITIKKKITGLTTLHAVMVSDIHLGVIVDNNRLEAMVEQINRLEPDIVFFAGDTIDEDVNRFVEQKMPEALRKLHARLGVFAVFGNHEYLGGSSQLAEEHLRQAGVHVLRDRYEIVNNQFYVVGRDDRMVGNSTGKPRLELSRLMAGIDHNLPVILLDHQPYHLEEGQKNGVDLQLSGHTHHGQFFPNNLITMRIFENDWGYLRKGDYQVVVSSGFGTWGPPIRIGNYPEIVDLNITFE